MDLTPQQVAHILAALRLTQGQRIGHMPHFEEEGLGPLSDRQVNTLCEKIGTSEPGDGHYTVVGLLPDSDWDSCMRDASFVDFVETGGVLEAAKKARVQVAWRRLIFEDEEDKAAIVKRVEEYVPMIEILAVFQGHIADLYDPAQEVAERITAQTPRGS